jgi:hypothetical protein
MRDVAGTLRWVAIVAALLAVGAYVQGGVSKMREAKAFYRWIQAAATNERILQSRSDEYTDNALYAEVESLADTLLAGNTPVTTPEPTDSSLLSQLVADVNNNPLIWDFAKGDSTAGLRAKFIDSARKNQLLFAKNLDFADAQAKNVSLFNMFFGFRKIAANLLWIEVDRNYRLGQVYRVIPMMKTVTALDPNFVDAYLIGAWHLAYNVTAKMSDTPPALLQWNEEYQACVGDKEIFYHEAAEFLKDGVRNNPRDYKLYFDLGFGIYSEKLQDYDNAVLYLNEAVRQPHERWVPRMLYRALEANGQYKESLAGWQGYKQQYPTTGFDTADRFIIRTSGLVEEQNGDQLMAQARTIEDAAKRAEIEAQAKHHYDEAKRLYVEAQDPYTAGRIIIIDARDLAAQGRYLEAQALLDSARWDVGELFETMSNLIIEYKQAGNIPLNVSERKEVMRRAEGGCTGAPAAATEVVPQPS